MTDLDAAIWRKLDSDSVWRSDGLNLDPLGELDEVDGSELIAEVDSYGAALRDVLDRHRPEPHVTGVTYCYEGCDGHYPCDTVADIAVRLKVTTWKELYGWPD